MVQGAILAHAKGQSGIRTLKSFLAVGICNRSFNLIGFEYLISTSKLRERLLSDILMHWMGHVTTFEHVSCSSRIQCSKAQNLSQTPKLIVPSRKHHLPLKTRNCAFGNAKKHGLISQFGLFNRFFSLELKNYFQKA